MNSIRLQKFIADCGVTSRRKAENLIVEGRVSVNGNVVVQLGTKVDPSIDVVHVDGEVIDLNTVDKYYVLLNKPRGFVTTVHDPEGRHTVIDLMPQIKERIYPVGRLDYLSEGLLLLTNDGELANIVMHPKYEVIKVYEVKVFGAITEEILRNLRKGAMLDGELVKPKSVRVIKQLKGKTWLEFRLGEGKNREIRRICEAHELTVDKLRRVAIGELTIEGMGPGKWDLLEKKDILKKLGLNENGMKVKEVEYRSPKKSISLKKVGAQPLATVANDPNFQVFRKDSYFETVRGIKQKRIEEEKRKKEEAFKAKEEAHQKRKKKKKQRELKKAEKHSSAHAMFVK